MIVEIYQNPCNWFQIGWNIAIENPEVIAIPTTLAGWDLHEFKSGLAAAMYRRTLPKHWLV